MTVPSLRARPLGDFGRALDAQVREVEGAMRRAITTTGQQVQSELRAQARNAGFRDGGRAVANTWRLTIYPGAGRRTLHPAALVWSKMPDVVRAFDQGAVVRPGKGREFLAWPTGYNATRGRRGAGRREGVRVTPEQMMAAGRCGEAFVIRSKSNPNISLWCLRVAGAVGTTQRTRRRVRLFVGTSTEVVTGRVKGLQQRRKEILKQGFVPMFFLSRQVFLRKRLNVDYVRGRAPGILAAAVRAELDALG